MTYHLQIVTPNGRVFDGEAERLLVPATEGQLMVLPKHVNFVTTLSMGPAKVTANGTERHGICIGGMLAVTDGNVKVLGTAFEWADQIDRERAEASKAKAESLLAKSDLDEQTRLEAKARLKRAQLRLSIVGK